MLFSLRLKSESRWGWITQSVSSEIQVRSETNFIMLSWDLIAIAVFVLTWQMHCVLSDTYIHTLIFSRNSSISYNFYVCFIILTVLHLVLENTLELLVFLLIFTHFFLLNSTIRENHLVTGLKAENELWKKWFIVKNISTEIRKIYVKHFSLQKQKA